MVGRREPHRYIKQRAEPWPLRLRILGPRVVRAHCVDARSRERQRCRSRTPPRARLQLQSLAQRPQFPTLKDLIRVQGKEKSAGAVRRWLPVPIQRNYIVYEPVTEELLRIQIRPRNRPQP